MKRESRVEIDSDFKSMARVGNDDKKGFKVGGGRGGRERGGGGERLLRKSAV